MEFLPLPTSHTLLLYHFPNLCLLYIQILNSSVQEAHQSMKPQLQQQSQPILITLNKSKSNQQQLQLDQRLTNFNLHPIESTDYSQPFQIPQQIATSETPFQLVCRFAQAHSYSPSSPSIAVPIASSNYRQVVDPITYDLCYRYTNLDLVAEIDEILRLAKWLQFGQLERAIAAAVAVNYYTGMDEKEIQEFMERNKIGDIEVQQVEQIYEEYRDLFQYVEQKTKQEFIGEEQVNNPVLTEPTTTLTTEATTTQ